MLIENECVSSRFIQVGIDCNSVNRLKCICTAKLYVVKNLKRAIRHELFFALKTLKDNVEYCQFNYKYHNYTGGNLIALSQG